MFKDILKIRRDLLTQSSRKLLLSSGVPPLPSIVNKLIKGFSSFTKYNTASKPTQFRSSSIINSTDIISVAKELAYDTDTLTTWQDTFSTDFQKSVEEIDRRVSFLENRLSNRSTDQKTLLNVGLTNFDYVESLLSSVDINSGFGRNGNGEAVLKIGNSFNTKVEFTIASLNTSSSVIPLNITNYNKKELPIGVVIPKGILSDLSVILSLNSSHNTVIMSALTDCQITIYTSDNYNTTSGDWEQVSSGNGRAGSHSILRYSPTDRQFIKIVLSNPKNEVQDNGKVLGIDFIEVANLQYFKSGSLITKSLINNTVKGVRVTVEASIPENSSIDMAGSFISQTGASTAPVKLSNNTKTVLDYTSEWFNKDTVVSSVFLEEGRFYTIPTSVDTTSNVDLFAGVDQWVCISRAVNNTELDLPLSVDIQSSTNTPEASISSDIYLDSRNALVGSIDLISSYLSITGSIVSRGPLFTNTASYLGDPYSTHLSVVLKDGVNTYLVPGREYTFTTSVYVSKDVSQQVSSTVPGGEYLGGTLPHQLKINGKVVLSAETTSLTNVSSWVYTQSVISFKAGWNKVQLLISVPNRDKEISGTLPSALRVSFNPLDSVYKSSYNITSVRGKKDKLKEISLFALQFTHPIQDNHVWSMKKISSTTSSIILNSSYRHSDSITVDGTIHGIPTTLLVSENGVSLCNGFWLNFELKGDTLVSPEIQSIKIEARK